MADVIYKYGLPAPNDAANGEFVVKLPFGAELLSVQLQSTYQLGLAVHTPMLWARVDNQALPEPRRARWIATGEPITFNEEFLYVDTVQFTYFPVPLVFHLYVEARKVLRG